MDLEIYFLIGFGNWDFMPDVINKTRDSNPYHFRFICDLVLFTLLLLLRSVYICTVFFMQVILFVKNLFDLGYSVFDFRYSVFDFGTLCSTSVLCIILRYSVFDFRYYVFDFRYSLFDFGTLCSTLGTLYSKLVVLCVRLKYIKCVLYIDIIYVGSKTITNNLS